MNIKLTLKKWIGSWLGIWCDMCGSPLEDIGYNFNTQCSNGDCFTRQDPARFDAEGLRKLSEKHTTGYVSTYSETNVGKRKRGRPKKSKAL